MPAEGAKKGRGENVLGFKSTYALRAFENPGMALAAIRRAGADRLLPTHGLAPSGTGGRTARYVPGEQFIAIMGDRRIMEAHDQGNEHAAIGG